MMKSIEKLMEKEEELYSVELMESELEKVVGGISLGGGSAVAEDIIRDVHHEVRNLIAKYFHAYEYVSLNAVDSDLVRAERYIDKRNYSFAIRELEGAIWELEDVEDSKCHFLIDKLHEAIRILAKL